MKRTMVCVAVVALVLVCAEGAMACPASYVKNWSQTGAGNWANQGQINKANQVASGYIQSQGVNPSSPAGNVIQPYMVGTTLVEHSWGSLDLDNQSVDWNLQQALNGSPSWHFQYHYQDGENEARTLPTQVLDKQGG